MKEKQQRDLRMRELEQTEARLEAEQQETEGKASVTVEERRALESIQGASVELVSVIVRNGWKMNRRTICTRGTSKQPTEVDMVKSSDGCRSSKNESLRRRRLSNNSRIRKGSFAPSKRSCFRESSLRRLFPPKASKWRKSRTRSFEPSRTLEFSQRVLGSIFSSKHSL